jgi:hypothetical protein
MTEKFKELIPIKNSFYLGNYGGCLTSIDDLGKINNEEMKKERDLILYRSHIGLGEYEFIISSIKENAPIEHMVRKHNNQSV